MQSILGGLGRNQNVLGKKARLLSAYLTYYDTIFLVDDSATVKQNEWKEIQESLLGLCEEAAKFDENGISVQFFNDPTKLRNTKNVHDVKNAFSKVKPMGTANVGKKLKELMDEHNSASGAAQKISQKALYDVKPLSIVVLTDGEFTEEPHEIISQIRRALQVTKTIHSPQDINRRIGIQFVQVGQDSAARDALNGLDNALPAEEDMIDTVRWNKGLNTETLYKILLGSIYDTIDQHGDTRAVGQQQQQHAGGYQSGGQQQQQPSGHQAGGMSSKPPGMSDTNKPIDGLNCNGGDYHQPLARHEYAIRIPARHKATVTAQANAQLPQRVNLFLHPQRDGFPLFFEGKGEKQVMEVRHVGNKVRIDATSQDTWMVISTEFGLPCGRMTKWVAAPNKRISQNGSNFVIGSDDGGVTMNPDGDYNDALVTVTVQAE
ncbi:hypothetical protein BKA62DRAFT_709650 [Auriculariales sp. MPI-PUGE-AT-0066]|nr:hypothetical protein BKA62DRAFT_709650 [Auriculariales sp. MPI-PUGE-AT-0066]